MASPSAPLPATAPVPPGMDPQAIRACLTPKLASEFDAQWHIVPEEAKQPKNLAGINDFLRKWQHVA